MTTLAQRQVMTPTPYRLVLPHVPIQPLRKEEGIQQTRDISRTEALLALRQTILMAHRLNSTTARNLQPPHRTVIPLAQTQVFNRTPMYASKETE